MRLWLRQHERAADALLGAGIFVFTVAGPMREIGGWPPDPAGTALLAVACLGLTWRRRWPIAVWVLTLAIGMATTIVMAGTPFATLPALVAVYTVAARVRTDRAIIVGVATAGFSMAVVLGAGTVFSDRALSLVASSGLATAVGIAVRAQRNLLDAAHERARQAELTREEEAQRRVTDERLRIARELHDVVAHNIAVINVQAGAAAHLLRSDPDGAGRSIDVIRGASRSVLQELSAMLGLLRTQTDDVRTAPAPGLRNLETLVGAIRSTGLEVAVERSCEPDPPISDVVDLTAYRVLQEALTNAYKHGTGTAELLLTGDQDSLCIHVTNPVLERAITGDPGGHGLVGMRERVAAVGGSLTAGPDGDGNFTVDVRLPKVAP